MKLCKCRLHNLENESEETAMERRKLTKEDIDKVCNIEGFPIGTYEDIIALSDAPFYTACPNPFIEDFIKEHGTPYDEATDDYHREPFAADVSEGKNDPIYMAHTYHTKVPYKAIMRYILHYTKPGDVVFDGFCGSGMIGVAAQMCGSNDVYLKAEMMQKTEDVIWGQRYAVLNDLSPMATFIANGYNTPFSMTQFVEEFETIMSDVEEECSYLYQTKHSGVNDFFGEQIGDINYVVWSDVFICPHCGQEIVFWDAAVDTKNKKIDSDFVCTKCGVSVKKASCERSVIKILDATGEVVDFAKQVPVRINYTYRGKRYDKTPDAEDLQKIERLGYSDISAWFPVRRMCEGIESMRNDISGITHVHHFMTPRNLLIFSKIFSHQSIELSRIVFTSVMMNCTKTYRFRTNGKGGALSGTLYIPSLYQENNIFQSARRKYKDFLARKNSGGSIISCGSTTDLPIPENSIDYIFTDPPFGSNLNYSELSYIWEAWLNVQTQQKAEAVMNKVQEKGLLEYQELMTKCFSEYYRVLKPNRWITIEFHNSQNSVWNAIQEGVQKAGFIVADVRTLDKKQDSFKQVKTTGAVKQDLVISAYKPKDSFMRDIMCKAGSEETAWDFVRQHLENIPIVVINNDCIEVISERQAYLLFDRMVAYHIMQGIPVPLDATNFYHGLDEKFLKRDNMYFLPDQVNEYDTARITTEVENIQFELFVTNEKSAISWLYQQLDEQFCGPQTYAELQPKFMQEVKAVDKYEQMPELSTILEENFLQDEKGRWYIPDVTKEGDLVKLREKNLWKEFEGYMNSKGKLKLFRSEAIRVGFSRLWKEKNYKAIVDIAERLPEQTIQEDSNLLMYYDISLGRV